MDEIQSNVVDDLDRRILREYQQDATVSYNTLAERLKVPSSTIFNRIRRMTSSGVIKGIIPLIDSDALGRSTTAWVRMCLDADVDCCEFAERMAQVPGVMEVHEIAGEWDIMVKVKVDDNLALHDFTKGLDKIQGINGMSTLISLKTVKEDPRIPIP